MGAVTHDAVSVDLGRLAAEIQHEHQAVELALRDSLAHARRAGELLIKVKEKLPHGEFMPWVEQNCLFSQRSANLYMRIARGWDKLADWQRVATLSLRQVGELLADETATPTPDADGVEPLVPFYQPRQGTEPPPSSYEPAMVSVASLRPHPRNYKAHPDDQLQHIMQSIREHGFYRNVVVARDNTILAGHGLVEAATELGCIRVPVIRLELDPNEPRALKILVGDNELGHLADRDPRTMTELLKEVKDKDDLAGTGYDEMQLAALRHVITPRSELPDFDAAAEWLGMPDYDREGTPIRLIITFPTEADRAAYVAEHPPVVVTKRQDTLKVWSAHWPEVERHDLSSLKWTTDERPVPLVIDPTEHAATS